jgi:hypothetical protein
VRCRRLASLWILAFGGFTYDAAFDYSPPFPRPWVDPFAPNGDALKWAARSDDRVYRYNTRTGAAWELVATMPHRRSSNILFVSGRKVFLLYGWDGTPSRRRDYDGRFLEGVDVFDLDKLQFEASDTAISAPPRRALTSGVWNGKLVILGGIADNDEPVLNATVFDPTQIGIGRGPFSDQSLPRLPTTMFSPGACFTGDRFAIAGGSPGPGQENGPWNRVYTLKPGDSDWILSPKRLSQPVTFVELVPISTSRVLALGGHLGGNPFKPPVCPAGLWEFIDL